MARQNNYDLNAYAKDEDAIKLLATFSTEKQALVKGVIIGLDMARKSAVTTPSCGTA